MAVHIVCNQRLPQFAVRYINSPICRLGDLYAQRCTKLLYILISFLLAKSFAGKIAGWPTFGSCTAFQVPQHC